MHSASPEREPTLHELRVGFPKADVFCASNGMNYAKANGTVIAAAPSTTELREQMQDFYRWEKAACKFCGAKIRRAGVDRWLLANAADINGYCTKSDDEEEEEHHPEIEEGTTGVVERERT